MHNLQNTHRYGYLNLFFKFTKMKCAQQREVTAEGLRWRLLVSVAKKQQKSRFYSILVENAKH